MADIDITGDTLAKVATLARQVGEMPRMGTHDGVRDDEERDDIRTDFETFVDALSDDEKYALIAVTWIGRGDFEPQEYPVAFERARDEATAPTTTYLSDIPLLADYLEEGMEALGMDPAEAQSDLA